MRHRSPWNSGFLGISTMQASGVFSVGKKPFTKIYHICMCANNVMTKYSRTSMIRTLMARLPWLFRIHS